ncbi:MAG: A/G-specific adenine glycosylase [Clostridia bacterium]|nr:A/G-specific adenine glycosylase [Clostridia bacterium]
MKSIFTEEITASLLAWYERNKRDLPWRRTRDPYRIWLSEIMLQQTRVEAVKPYYARFLEACPTVEVLAELPEDRLMKLWEGLGYYSRARNLQKAARTVTEQYGGVFPKTYDELRSLNGIGDYTAGAIASIAFDVPVPAVDGNVLRVLARLLGSFEDIALPITKREWSQRLSEVIPCEAGSFNQALIELGAVVCVPNGEAKCDKCPMREVCRAAKEALTDSIPVKSAKKPRRIEERTVLLIRDDSRTVIGKRPDKGLLAGLFELPNPEGHMTEKEVADYVRALGLEPIRIERIEDSKHIFTHIEWQMIAYEVTVTAEFDGFCPNRGLMIVENVALRSDYAIPSAFAAYKKKL